MRHSSATAAERVAALEAANANGPVASGVAQRLRGGKCTGTFRGFGEPRSP